MQPEEGSWFLEDLSGIIKLDLSHCQSNAHHYFYTQACQVIVQGVMINGVFHVEVR